MGDGVGSIPACAGEPRRSGTGSAIPRVYPRVCGGTCSRTWPSTICPGLSPRVRGNLFAYLAQHDLPGSIPACAGEPTMNWPACPCARVYPRVCGGTLMGMRITALNGGLSPRVRGNLLDFPQTKSPARSIPACAGEPSNPARPADTGRVYPRVCGGTVATWISMSIAQGLSPRVRGNPVPGAHWLPNHRSIPACAGEPSRPAACHPPGRVYPRVCGGTALQNGGNLFLIGLSPRVRGNRPVSAVKTAIGRSIPACAGEPASQSSGRPTLTVYPRVCGGTPSRRYGNRQCGGLSPRVRGNPR